MRRMSRNCHRLKVRAARSDRRGAISVLAAFMLVILFAFMAMAIDIGRVMHKRTSMQNACDAAALAASLEITEAAAQAAANGQDPASFSEQQAQQMAFDVAFANGVSIDQANDVEFGGAPMTQVLEIGPFPGVRSPSMSFGSTRTAITLT